MHRTLAGFFGGSNWHATLGAALKNAASECSTPMICAAIAELQQLLDQEPPLQSRAVVTKPLPRGLEAGLVIEILHRAFPPNALRPEMIEPIKAVHNPDSNSVELSVVMACNPSTAAGHAEKILEASIRGAVQTVRNQSI